MPTVESCDWIKCKHNSYKPGDKKAGKCQKDKIKLISKNDKLICSTFEKF